MFSQANAGTDCTADGMSPSHVCGSDSAAGTCVQCNTPSDCPVSTNECSPATCSNHVCGTNNLGQTHTLSTGQVPHDCQKVVCDGNGGTMTVADDTDLPVSNTVCKSNPACLNGTPQFDYAPGGTDCTSDGQSGKRVCGDALDAGGSMPGTCVECNVPEDCPIPEGGSPNCINNTCQ
jgi:hypothetical protein